MWGSESNEEKEPVIPSPPGLPQLISTPVGLWVHIWNSNECNSNELLQTEAGRCGNGLTPLCPGVHSISRKIIIYRGITSDKQYETAKHQNTI